MKIIYKILSGGIAIAVMISAFMAYFMRTLNLQNQILYDGLGRQLSEPPLLVKMFITQEPVWAGFGWHLFDLIWFWSGLALAYFLFSLSEE